MRKRVLLVNKFIPPDTAPTSQLIGAIGRALEADGWDVAFAGRRSGYSTQSPSLIRRLADEAGFHCALLAGSLFSRHRPDLVIALTSPPGLIVPASLLAKLSRSRLIHWCMDLYPDVAVALGALPAGRIEALIRWATVRAYRTCDLVVALDDDMAERFGAAGVDSEVLAPWPPDWRGAPAENAPDMRGAWLYSGNLGRAHDWETMLEAQAILERSGSTLRLVIQGSGPAQRAARERASSLGLQRVEWRPPAPEGGLLKQIHEARALVASQRPETTGMLYPSKLSTLTLTETPLIWIGSPVGAIAAELRGRPDTLVAPPGDAAQVAAFLRSLPSRPRLRDLDISRFLEKATERRNDGLERWKRWASRESAEA